MGTAAKISPFAPKALPTVPVIDGVRFATVEAGIRYKNRTDLMLCMLDAGTVAHEGNQHPLVVLSNRPEIRVRDVVNRLPHLVIVGAAHPVRAQMLVVETPHPP